MATPGNLAVPRHPLASIAALRQSPAPVGSVLDHPRFSLTRSGRSAIVLALRLAGIGKGARVFVPDYYCPTMVAAVEYAGAIPVFYPVLPSREPDTEWLGRQDFAGVGAVLAVHFFGLPVRLGGLRTLCDQRGAVLVEDCAHALFGEVDGVPVGHTGHFAIASLPKFLPVIEGGVLAWQGDQMPLAALGRANLRSELKGLANIVEASARHGALPFLNQLVLRMTRGTQPQAGSAVLEGGIPPPERPWPDAVRAEALADPLLEPVQLRHIEQWLVGHSNRQRLVSARRANYMALAGALARHSGIRVLFPEPDAGAVPYCVPLFVDAAEHVYPELRRLQLPVFRWDRYWPGSPAGSASAEPGWGHHVLQVSCHQDLTDEHIRTMSMAIVRSAWDARAR